MFLFCIFLEFDECSSIDHGCEQMCINNLGGYECACKVGYQLHSDNKHCEGTCTLFIVLHIYDLYFALNLKH